MGTWENGSEEDFDPRKSLGSDLLPLVGRQPHEGVGSLQPRGRLGPERKEENGCQSLSPKAVLVKGGCVSWETPRIPC